MRLPKMRIFHSLLCAYVLPHEANAHEAFIRRFKPHINISIVHCYSRSVNNNSNAFKELSIFPEFMKNGSKHASDILQIWQDPRFPYVAGAFDAYSTEEILKSTLKPLLRAIIVS